MAKATRRDEPVRLLGAIRRDRSSLLVSTALQAVAVAVVAMPAWAQLSPNARPTGGIVVGGQAAITNTATTTTITQTTQQTAINWQSFNVGSQQMVQFVQPNASAMALNRVVGPDPSQIAGKITANGQIVIENQSGVIFYNGSQVDTNGLIVTALGITDRNFMAGKLIFDQPAKANAQIVNQGNLTVRGAGLAALVAPSVANSGVIDAKLGNVILAGAQAATLDLYGDGLVSLNVTRQVTQAPNGSQALVVNTGTIKANGGHVTLTAAAADGVVSNLVSAGGKINANTVGTNTGTVIITGVGGNIEITGQLSAQGLGAGTKGGSVQVNTTGTVALRNTARINASGRAGGGTVAIGTTLKRAGGGPSVMGQPTAAGVTIAPGAIVQANATDTGNGGIVTVLSTGTTDFRGTITATGINQGGIVEVSGNTGYIFTGKVDVSAPSGTAGSILLDPLDLDIVANGSGTGNANVTSNGVPFNAPDEATSISVDVGSLTALSGNLTIQASRNLTIDAVANFANQTGGAGGNVTIQAGNNLIVNRAVSTGGGDLSLSAATSGFANSTTTGTLAINAGAVLSTTGNITLAAGSGGIAINTNKSIVANVLDVSTTGGGIVQSSSAVLNINTLQSTGGVVGAVVLAGSANAIASIGTFPVTSGNFTLTDTGSVNVAGPLTGAATVAISSDTIGVSGSLSAGTLVRLAAGAGGIQLNTGHIVNAPTIDLSATGGGITQVASGSLIASTVLQSSGGVTGTISLPSTTNTIAAIGAFAVTSGDFDVTSTGSVHVTGPATANNVALNAGTIGVVGSIGAGTLVSLASGGGGIAINTGGIVTGPSITLNGGSGGIRINGSAVVGQVGAVLDLDTSGQGVIQSTAAVSTIIAGTLLSSSGVTGNVSLTGSKNTIASIGSFGVTSGSFNEVSNGTVTVNGPLTTDQNISLSANAFNVAGSIGATGSVTLYTTTQGITVASAGIITGTSVVLAGYTGISLLGASTVGQAGATVNLSTGATNASVVQSTSATVVAGTLVGSYAGVGITGSLSLAGTANAISTIGTMPVTGNASIVDSSAVTIASTLSSQNGSVSVLGTPTITVAGTVSANTAVILSAGTGGILWNSGLVSGPTVDLSTTGGGITQAAGATLNAGTLQSASGVTGTVALGSTKNTVGAIGSFSVSSGDFNLLTTGSVAVQGPLTATNIALNAGTIGVTGSLIATTLASLGAGAGGIAINTGLVQGATVDVSASGGGVTQASVATLSATTVLQSTSNIVGGASFAGTHNTIGALGNMTVTGGNLSVLDAAPLVVTGTVSAPNVYLESNGVPNQVTIAATGSVIATGSVASFQSDQFTILSGGSVSANTVELAPYSAGTTITLGNGGSIPSVAGLGTNIRIGGITSSGSLVTTAGAIQVIGAFGSSTVNLELDATGAVTNISGKVLTANTLTGSMGTLALTGANVGTVGSVAAGAGGFSLDDGGNAGLLTLAGPITSGSGAILATNAGTVVVTGSLNASSSIGLSSGAGGITVATTGTLVAPTVSLNAGAGGIALNGSASVGTATSTVSLVSTGSVTEASTAIITAATLAGSAADAQFPAPNAIANLGGFAVAGGNFNLNDSGNTGNLIVSGPVTAGTVTIGGAGTVTVAGSIGATTLLTLAAGSGGIALNAAAILSGPTVDVSTTGGGITEASGATLAASAILQSTSGVVGTVALGSIKNKVVSIGSFAVSGGDFTLADNGDTGNLTVSGPLTAGNVSITGANKVTVAGSIGAATVLALASGTGGITINGGAILSSPTVDLSATGGGVTEATGGTILANALLRSGSGVTGTVDLRGTANNVAKLGGFAVTSGDFTLADDANTGNLTISGPVTADNVTISGTRTITVTGSIGATATLGLTAGSGGIALNGTETVSGATVDLSTTGEISEATGAVLVASTLTSSAGLGGSASLRSADNLVGQIADITVASGTIALTDSVDLTIAGKLSAHEIVVIDTGHTITVNSGARIVTDGSTRPAGSILAANLPTATTNSNGGAYFSAATFKQSGTLTVSTLSGTPNTVRIDATKSVALATSGGLSAPNTWLILNLTNAASASGAINVKALDVSYSGAGSAKLTGSVAGLSGYAATSAGNIEPGLNSGYQLNSCAIHSVSCTVAVPVQQPTLPTTTQVVAPGLLHAPPDLEIGFFLPFGQSDVDNQDIIVPLISDVHETLTFYFVTDLDDLDPRHRRYKLGTYRLPPRGLNGGILPISDVH